MDRNGNNYGYDFFGENPSDELRMEEMIDRKVGAIKKNIIIITVVFVLVLGLIMVSVTTVAYNDLANSLKKDYTEQIAKVSDDVVKKVVDKIDYQYDINGGTADIGSVVWKKNQDAIIEVYCYKAAYADQTSQFSATASAFVINEEGYLITNAHVVTYDKITSVWGIGETKKTMVYGKLLGKFKNSDAYYELSVIAYDLDLDLAVMKFKENPAEFSYVTFMDSDCVVMGQSAVVIGNAEGLGISVATGTVTNIGVVNDSQEYIQTDAAVNHGNSGGPIFNSVGYCMGVVTSKIAEGSADGIGFAIHSNQTMAYIDGVAEKNGITIKYYLYEKTAQSSQNS